MIVPVFLAVWAASNTLEKWVAFEFIGYFSLVFIRVYIEIKGTLNFAASRAERALSLKILLGFSISIIIMFAAVYKYYGLIIDESLTQTTWMDSIYFSIVTWTTLGYGDVQPTESIRLVAAFQAFVGYLYMGLLIGGIAGLLFNKEQNA